MHVAEHNFNSVSAADLYYNILDGGAAGHGIPAAGCAPLSGADNASAQVVTVNAQSPPSMVHNPAAAWADFVSQPLFVPGNGGGDLQYAVDDGDFIKLCRAADAFPPPENGGAASNQCKPADLVAQQEAVRSLPAFLEPKCAGGFAADPAMGPVMDFMEAILGSSSTSAVSASSIDSFSANTGMQPHCWIP